MTFFLLSITLALSACSTQQPLTKSYGDEPPVKVEEKVKAPEQLTIKDNTMSTQTDNKAEMERLEIEDLYSQYSHALIKTNQGDIKVKLYGDKSPLTVNNFLSLADKKYYDGIRFHRVIPDFMIQAGDPNSKDISKKNSWGMGGPGYTFVDEFNEVKLVKGSLAMANAGPGTNGSQFFIVTAAATPWLDGKHTNFGEVVEGMDVVDKIGNTPTGEADRPVSDVIIEKIELVK